jgi:hypothetical protein
LIPNKERKKAQVQGVIAVAIILTIIIIYFSMQNNEKSIRILDGVYSSIYFMDNMHTIKFNGNTLTYSNARGTEFSFQYKLSEIETSGVYTIQSLDLLGIEHLAYFNGTLFGGYYSAEDSILLSNGVKLYKQ